MARELNSRLRRGLRCSTRFATTFQPNRNEKALRPRAMLRLHRAGRYWNKSCLALAIMMDAVSITELSNTCDAVRRELLGLGKQMPNSPLADVAPGDLALD
jgi:hypothetical protein